MIGKVVRGNHAGGLLRYLYGPGRANEHIDPHLVAGFGDPAELEPECRLDGTPDLRRRCLDALGLPTPPPTAPGPQRQDRAVPSGRLPGQARAADDGRNPRSSAAEGRRDTPGIAGCRKILTVKPRSNDLEPGYRIR